MRTHIVLDEALVEDAMRYVEVKSKRELLDLALREFIAARRRPDLSDLFGTVEIDPDYDYKALRREHPWGVSDRYLGVDRQPAADR